MKHPEAKPPYRQPPKIGERPRCRWCWSDCPPRRHTFCSKACVTEFQEERDWTTCRHRAWMRDRGVCAVCGCDTAKLKRVLEWAKRWRSRLGCDDHGGPSDRETFFGTKRGGYGFYEIDHVVARADGGNHALDNLRTLCVACHRDVTTAQAADRAEIKRAAKAVLFAEVPA